MSAKFKQEIYIIAYRDPDICGLDPSGQELDKDNNYDYDYNFCSNNNKFMSWADLVEEEELYSKTVLPPWSFLMPPARRNKDMDSDTDSVFENTQSNGAKKKQNKNKNNKNATKEDQRQASDNQSVRERRNLAREARIRQQKENMEIQNRLMAVSRESADQTLRTQGVQGTRSGTAPSSTSNTAPNEATSHQDGASSSTNSAENPVNVGDAQQQEEPVPGPSSGHARDEGDDELRFPILYPARFVLHQGNQPGHGAPRSQSTGALSFVTPQGLEREAQMRKRIAEIEKNNPVNINQNKDVKKQAPDNYTFEVTNPDLTPVNERYRIAGKMLKRARMEYDEDRDGLDNLKFSSRTLRSGDWIVWAENESTLAWLKDFFSSSEFNNEFRATLVSDRGPLVRYAIKVQGAEDASEENQKIVDHMFKATGYPGYFRISDELRWYADPAVQKAYTAAKKNRKKYNPPADAEFDKMFFLKVSKHAHMIMRDNWDRIRFHFGLGKLKVELAKGSENILNNKRSRPDGGDEEERPAQQPRQDEEAQVTQLDGSPEQAETSTGH